MAPSGLFLGQGPSGPLVIDPTSLTTHAVCVGATGAGKTGLLISLIEEAALSGAAVIAIDPKGDLGNLLLTFAHPDASQLTPWVDPHAAARAGQSVEAYGASEAARLAQGVAENGPGAAAAARLASGVRYTLYTPGSDAGVRLSLVPSLTTPGEAVRSSRELLRERAQTVAESLLCLAGVAADQGKGREQALLTALLQEAWSTGRELGLEALVRAVERPFVERVGLLDIEAFFPAKERFELLLALNQLLEGEPERGGEIDLAALLSCADRRTNIAIVSVAHLGDAERVSFVAQLLSSLQGQLRKLGGSAALRALLVLDEAAGFAPPLSSPASKRPLLTLFKQARAFGMGVVVGSQNPADLDYKALGNAGTHLIGRLATARDRARVREGLGEVDDAGTSAVGDEQLASLPARGFVALRRGEPPTRFTSRHTVAYLRGPMSLEQLARAWAMHAPAQSSGPVADAAPGSRPIVPPAIEQIFVPSAEAAPVYAATLLSAARVRYVDRAHGVDVSTSLVLSATERAGAAVPFDWASSTPIAVGVDALSASPAPGASFLPVPRPLLDPQAMARLKKALVDHLVKALPVPLFVCPHTQMVSSPGEAAASFEARRKGPLSAAADAVAAREAERVSPRLRRAEDRLRKAQQALERQQKKKGEKKVDAALTAGVSLLSALLGKGGVVANAGKAARVAKGVARVAAAGDDIARAQQDLEAAEGEVMALEAEARDAAARARASVLSSAPERVVIAPRRADIEVLACGIGFVPFAARPEALLAPAFTPAPLLPPAT